MAELNVELRLPERRNENELIVIIRFRKKVKYGSVLMGKECLNIMFPGSVAYPAVCGIQREAENVLFFRFTSSRLPSK